MESEFVDINSEIQAWIYLVVDVLGQHGGREENIFEEEYANKFNTLKS